MSRGLRPPLAIPRLQRNKMRLVAHLSPEDLRSSLSFNPSTQQILLPHSNKSHSKHAFDTVFPPETTQGEISSSLLPDLIHGLFTRIDAALVSFGGVSRRKDAVLYSPLFEQQGLFQSAISSLFSIVDSSPDSVRSGYCIKLSAIHYSQRTNILTDLLSQFNTDPRRFPVRIVDDSSEGPRLENCSEIRVDSLDQAMFYLNTVIDHRLVEDEESHRTNHVFFSIILMSSEGRTSLHLVDLGMGERNSTRGSLSMTAIGNMLIALCQGQKHFPNRDHSLSLLLRYSIVNCRQTTLLSSFSDRIDENENILQFASKLSKARRTPRRGRSIGDSSSLSSSEKRKRNELESSSEQSAAETVIFLPNTALPPHRSSDYIRRTPHITPPDLPLKPLQLHSFSNLHPKNSPSHSSLGLHSPVHTPPGSSVPPLLKGYTPFFAPYSKVYNELCSPPGTSKGVIDDDDEEMPQAFGGIAVDGAKTMGVIGHGEEKKIHAKELSEDEKRAAILEWMEESNRLGRERLADLDEEDDFYEREREIRLPRPLEDIQECDEESSKDSIRQSILLSNGKHPLSILSQLDARNEDQENDSDLEKAMEASVSSIVSHELLSKVKNECDENEEESEGASEMDMYRRASQLEAYAGKRLKEVEEAERRRKKRLHLNCCQSMVSSTSTVVDKRRLDDEDKERKEELRKRRDELKGEEEELRRRREEIKKQLDTPILKQLTQHISSFTLKAAGLKKSHAVPITSDSLPSTPTVSSRKVVLPVKTPSLSNCSSPAHRGSKGSLKKEIRKISTKSRTPKEEDDEGISSPSNVTIRSPYAKVTPAKTTSGAESSGRGSDDNGSSVVGSAGKRSKKRESYSASSGYESATGDYRYYSKGESKNDRIRLMDRRCGLAAREVDRLRERQRMLRQDLLEAKERIGERLEEWNGGLEGKSALSHTTLVDTLIQENRILEKRLVACQNHAMLVTSLL